MADFRTQFIEFAIEQKMLCFGQFKTKAGRQSPYFFNTGLCFDGSGLYRLAQFYTKAIQYSKIEFDMLYGPAYKGIPLVASVAISLANEGRNTQFCFNRKEAKDHGEGGKTVGAPLMGRVLILDDVISAGSSIRESIELICTNGAVPAAVVVALDRMERGVDKLSAIEEIQQRYGISVIAIASLDNLMDYLRSHGMKQHLSAVQAYYDLYGLKAHVD